ncbi:hypothetical protein P5673_009832, partial [Acropora cervicornis]
TDVLPFTPLKDVNDVASCHTLCGGGISPDTDFRFTKERNRGRSSVFIGTEFLTLLEDSRRNPDLCQSVQWFQLTVDEAKVQLDLAVCPGASLLPSKMVVVIS